MGGSGFRNSAEAKSRTYLVIGGDGQLGSALVRSLKEAGRTVVATTRRVSSVSAEMFYLDLRKAFRVSDLPVLPDTVFLCGAETSLIRCEQDPGATRFINVDRTVAVADVFLREGVRVVYPSTNLVFDGRRPFVEAAAPLSPVTEYGRQKADVELHLVRSGEKTVVVRLTKVVHPALCLIQQWTRKLAENHQIRAYSDRMVSPVSLSFAVDAMIKMSEEEKGGVWQVSGSEEVSYHALAVRLAVAGGWDPSLVGPVGAKDSFSAGHSSLDTSRMEEQLGLCPPEVFKTVEEMVLEAREKGRTSCGPNVRRGALSFSSSEALR